MVLIELDGIPWDVNIHTCNKLNDEEFFACISWVTLECDPFSCVLKHECSATYKSHS